MKLKVNESVFMPLAKWSMLLAGNYRCVQGAGMRSIRYAVHSDLDLSRGTYAAVGKVCVALGAAERNTAMPIDHPARVQNGLLAARETASEPSAD